MEELREPSRVHVHARRLVQFMMPFNAASTIWAVADLGKSRISEELFSWEYRMKVG